MRSVQPIILRHSYTRRRDVARAALRYYQMRPRGEGEPPRSLFTKGGTISRAEAGRMLDDHQAHAYLAHRLMLSPPAGQHPDDLPALTRHVMRELEREKRQTLHWVAVEHRNTAHPHVHVLLCGGGEQGDAVREVRLDRRDHAQIKEDGMDYCRLAGRIREGWDAALVRAAAEHDRAGMRSGLADRDR